MSQLQSPSQWQPMPEWQQQPQLMPQRQQPQQQQPQQYVAAKNPGIAVLLSILFPGAGNFYAGQTGWGVFYLLAWCVSAVLCFVIIGLVLLPMVYIGAMVHAWLATDAFNKRNGLQVK
jgi:TM2 domain-containing membrane protein YozV